MNLPGYLCIGGIEIINDARSIAYGLAGLAPGPLTLTEQICPALDDTYVDPATDDAPWYTATRPESEDFLGLIAERIDLSQPLTRSSQARHDFGTVLGPEEISSRVVSVTGFLVATSQMAMYYGERWLTEALRGTKCAPNCSGDEMTILPFCDGAGNETDFRTLVGAAVAQAPLTDPVVAAECLFQRVHFSLEAGIPWLYEQPLVAVDEQVNAGTSACARIEVDDWLDGEALTISIDADTAAVATGLTLTVTQAVGDTCPETLIRPSITYDVPVLVRSSGLVIDAARFDVSYENPTAKRAEPGFEHLTWGGGPFPWPILPPCVTVCVCLTNDGAVPVSWKIERRKRAL